MKEVRKTQRSTVLVIEPDPLLRWSLRNYLGGTFDILSAESPLNAAQVIRGRTVDAIVFSDDLGAEAEAICRVIRRTNPTAFTVRMLARAGAEQGDPQGLTIDKPFQLAALRNVLLGNIRQNDKARAADS